MLDETQLISMMNEIVQNPFGKVLLSILAYMVALSNAKAVGGELKARGVSQEQNEHNERVERYAKRKLVMLKNRIYKMVSLFGKISNSPSITLQKGHGNVEYKDKRVYLDTYFEEARKNILEVHLQEIIKDFEDKANTFAISEDRDNYLDEYAKDYRESLLSDIHKRVGSDSRTEKVEDSYITFEYIREMLHSILTESEKSNNIMKNNIESIEKKYYVNSFNVFKVFQALKGKLK